MLEKIVIGCVVAAAALFLVRRFLTAGKAPSRGCSGCAKAGCCGLEDKRESCGK